MTFIRSFETARLSKQTSTANVVATKPLGN